MKKMALGVLKNALIMFAIGMTVATVAPYLGALAGLAPTIAGAQEALGIAEGFTGAARLGLFFGTFGAASSIITPVVNGTFSKIGEAFSKRKLTKDTATLGVAGAATILANGPDAPATNELPIEHVPHTPEVASTHFQDMVTASKATSHTPNGPSIV